MLRTLVGTADDAAISCAAQYVVGESGFPGEPSSIAAYENPFSAWHKSRGYAAVLGLSLTIFFLYSWRTNFTILTPIVWVCAPLSTHRI